MINFKNLRYMLLLPGIAVASTTSGPYLGISLGIANEINQLDPSTFNNNAGVSTLYQPHVAFDGRLNFGYNFSRYNGIELAPSYLFSQQIELPNNAGSANLQGTSLDLSYLPNLPLTANRWSIFGRIGASYNWLNLNNDNLTASATTFADILGAGVRYNVTPSNSFRLEWIANGLLFPIGINNGSSNVDLLTTQNFLATINFHF